MRLDLTHPSPTHLAQTSRRALDVPPPACFGGSVVTLAVCVPGAVLVMSVSTQAQRHRRPQVKGACKGIWSYNSGEKGRCRHLCEHPSALQVQPMTGGPRAIRL